MFFSVSKIKCDYPLPLSEEQLSFDAINWEDQDFMTMSLTGHAYTIEEDGQIYEELLKTHQKWWYIFYRIYSGCVRCVYELIKWFLVKVLQIITFIYQKIS
jgi:hypothetical protein